MSSGHSLSRSGVAKETLHVLNSSQQAALISLVEDQKNVFEDVRTARYNMNRALEGLLVGEELTRDEFLSLGASYGAAEAELGRTIGQRLGEVANSLSPSQKQKLNEIRVKHVSGQASKEKIRGIKTKLPKAEKKELINLAARLLSWTTGSTEDNDFEVVGKPSQHFGFVSLRIESNHGVKRGVIAEEVLMLLSADQKSALDKSAKYNLKVFDQFMKTRGQLKRTLGTALEGKIIEKSRVRVLGQDMGRAEADMTWAQAMAMLEVRADMSETQLKGLLDLRAKYTAKGSGLTAELLSRGRQLYAQCAMCHSDTGLSIGPSLKGVFDRKVAADVRFQKYSAAMTEFGEEGGIWDEVTLDRFLESPKNTIRGTYMGYDGLENDQDREALITYIKTRD